MPFSITPADIEAVWPADGCCPVLGIRFQRGVAGRARGTSPSLDRLNPAWGYELGNIAVISLTANRIKNVGRAQDLEKIAAWMRRQGLD